METVREKIGLNSLTLKVIATVTMLIDHIGGSILSWINSPLYTNSRIIGRLAFPIYCFLIVEGYFHTHDVKKYGRNLLIFAFISEFPFDFALFYKLWDTGHQNVFFTLFIGLAAIYAIDLCRTSKNPAGMLLCAVGAAACGDLLSCDYGARGVFLIILFYLMHDQEDWVMAICISVYIICIMGIGSATEKYAAWSVIPILLYNGKRGPKVNKYLFYVFYPAHLLVIGLVWLYYFNGVLK